MVTGAMVWAADSLSTSVPAGPPKVKTDNVEDVVQGHKIADPYRWMEDASSSETQAYVREEMAYTRSILDPLPGRQQPHRPLCELMTNGANSAPQIPEKFFLHKAREGTQNQPVLLVRDS